jgi:hypothetical protein
MADRQGEAAWGTSGQVTIGMIEYWNTGPGETEKSFTPVKQIYGLTGQAGQKYWETTRIIFYLLGNPSLHYSIIPWKWKKHELLKDL